MALLKLLISDVEAEISNGYFFPTFEHILQFSCLLHLVSIKQCRLIFFPTLFLLFVLKLSHDLSILLRVTGTLSHMSS